MNPNRKIRVLVVDDSAVVRKMISEALSFDPEIEVVGTACDPFVAREKILELNPDVMTLDIEMPRMDGLTFLRILQQHRPMPVVIISSLTQAGSRAALDAMEFGAVDVLAKPKSAWNLGDLRDQLARRVKAAVSARLNHVRPKSQAAPVGTNDHYAPQQIIVIGASTGGTEAIKEVLMRLPDGLPGILIVQHIPPLFSKTFAERLNELCAMEVHEAKSGDEVRLGMALVAPGDFHMTVEWEKNSYRVHLNQHPPIHYTRPAVDMLFNSAARCAGPNAVGVLLTGMGRDGAQGMQQLKAAGGTNIVQNEETCVVYGMPRAAVEIGAADKVLPLDHIPHAILHALGARASSRTETTPVLK
ncbi:MAG TPA: chemotaxis response regulator protein-glutamate methylesterase [Candidatus Sulfotelmatobacter sp.]|jgi:two-component system chemotaxis response regulator CheB|nr:chemotaxis response regulator protein-glutamate methylesterase [Candidatus Sulfotelmatobacter sp.]